jgi:hypothetical protein
VNVEVPFAHYLVENKIAGHCTHILSSSLPITVLPAKQNQKAAISFIILYQVNKIHYKPFTPHLLLLWNSCIQRLHHLGSSLYTSSMDFILACNAKQ